MISFICELKNDINELIYKMEVRFIDLENKPVVT